MSRLLATACAVLLVGVALGDFVNDNVQRTLDATTHILRVQTKVTARTTGGSASTYRHAMTAKQAERLAFLSASQGGRQLQVTREADNENEGAVIFAFALSTPAGVDRVAELTINEAFLHEMSPFPTEITQMETQLVKLRTNHYYYSPYLTTTQTASVKLASSRVEYYKRLKPSTSRGNELSFGPYTDVAPFSKSVLTVHFENNHPFLTLTNVEREVEVSHWGNVAVEEVFEMQHTGAALKGSFSRYDYQMQRAANGPHFRKVLAQLPASATDIYYRDIIGNITTSHVRRVRNGQEMEILPRFPMFGGWRTEFYTGYNVPLREHVSQLADGQFELTVGFLHAIQDAATNQYMLKVVLPEGATDVQVHAPFEVEEARSRRLTFLDSALGGGRPVVVLRKRSLVDEHNLPLRVTYRLASSALMVKPALLVGFFGTVFALAMLYMRVQRGAPVAGEPKAKAE